MLRTFSKAHGLAGLRVGYGLGPAELLAYCARMRNTFSVSSVAQAAALAAIDDQSHIERVVSNNAAEAKVMAEELFRLRISSSADFGELPLLRFASGCSRFRRKAARRRRERPSTGRVGSTQLHPCNHRNAGAEPVFLEGGSQGGGSRSAAPTAGLTSSIINLPLRRPASDSSRRRNPCRAVQSRIAAQKRARDDRLSPRARDHLRRCPFVSPHRIFGCGCRIDQ